MSNLFSLALNEGLEYRSRCQAPQYTGDSHEGLIQYCYKYLERKILSQLRKGDHREITIRDGHYKVFSRLEYQTEDQGWERLEKMFVKHNIKFGDVSTLKNWLSTAKDLENTIILFEWEWI